MSSTLSANAEDGESGGTPQAPPTSKELLELAEVLRGTQRYQLRLYIVGLTPRSSDAIRTIRGICDEYLAGRYELEVVDITATPARARAEQIVAAPTLVKSLPLPLRRLVGDLSDTQRVLRALELTPR
jgi:circadian clock protein KaiB